jgi:hypothetical protein
MNDIYYEVFWLAKIFNVKENLVTSNISWVR